MFIFIQAISSKFQDCDFLLFQVIGLFWIKICWLYKRNPVIYFFFSLPFIGVCGGVLSLKPLGRFHRIFWTIRCNSPPQIWEENGGASYSPNVAYIYIGEILYYLLLNILPHFLLQIFFSYFPLKPRCVLLSEKYGISDSQYEVLLLGSFRLWCYK